MELLPVLLVVAVYGAASYLLTTAIRKTLRRWSPSVELWLSRVEIAKRLLPCMVAFALMAASPLSLLSMFGLTLDAPNDFWSVAWLLSIFSGIFSGYAHRWIRDTFKRRGQAPSRDDDVPPDADRP